MKTMKELLPSWYDKEQGKIHADELKAYAAKNGFGPKEIENFSKDQRVVLALMKAKILDECLGTKKEK